MIFLKNLYFYVLLQPFIKVEQTIEKTPKFRKVIIGTLTTHKQSFNVSDCSIFKLLGLTACYMFMSFLKNDHVQAPPPLSPHPQKICSSPENPQKINPFKYTKLLLFAVFSPGCPFCFKSTRKYVNYLGEDRGIF